jgi:ABC-2 type transport system permease protein
MTAGARPSPLTTARLGPMLVEHTRAQLLTFLRNLALSVVTLVLPIVLFAFIASTDPAGEYRPGVSFGAFFLASMAAYAVSGVMIFNFGVSVATDRGARVDRLIRAGPVPPVLYLAARVITALVFAVLALAALFTFAANVTGVAMPVAQWLSLGAALLTGAFPFIALGFAISYLAGPNAAVAIANITYLVLGFASGIFIPYDALPDFVKAVAPYLPTYHYAQLAWGAVGMPVEPALESFAWLAGYGIALLAVAGWAWRREEGRVFG